MDVLIQIARLLAKHQRQKTPVVIPRRILYVVSHGQSYSNNSYAVRSQRVAKALNHHGFETLCLVRPGRPWDLGVSIEDIHPQLIVDGVRYLHINWPNGIQPKNEYEHLRVSVELLVEFFRVFRPQIVLAASDYRVGLPAWVSAQRFGLSFYNEVYGFSGSSCSVREPGYKQTVEFKAQAKRDAFVAKQAQRIFALNSSVKLDLGRRGVDKAKIDILAEGVNGFHEIKAADPEIKNKLGIGDEDKVIGHIGNFKSYEELDTLLEACEHLVEWGEKIKLLLDGSEILVAANQPWVVRVGQETQDMINEYYALIDVGVIPSRKMPWFEFMPPEQISEIMAYGKSIVVSDVDPLVEYIKKHKNVFIYPAEESCGLAKVLQRALKAPSSSIDGEAILSQVFIEPMVRVLAREWEEPKTAQPYKLLPDKISEPLKGPIASLIQKDYRKDNTTIQSVEEVGWQRYDLDGGNCVFVSGSICIQGEVGNDLILLVKLFDVRNEEISPIEVGLPLSEELGGGFINLSDTEGKKTQLLCLETDKKIEYLELAFVFSSYKEETRVEVRDLEVKAASRFAASVESDNQKKTKKPIDIKVAFLADDFSFGDFCSEFEVIAVGLDNWLDVFQESNPDVFFFESEWFGPNSVRQSRRGGACPDKIFNNENWKTLFSITSFCNTIGIPTVLWCNDNGKHNGGDVNDFLAMANQFDYIFTSSSVCAEIDIRNYEKNNVFQLPFAVNPRIFNPIELYERSDHVVFSGSWNATHDHRVAIMESVLDRLMKDGFTLKIYDRFFGDSDLLHEWPKKYRCHLHPPEPHDEMPKVYKSSIFGLDFNTEDNSSPIVTKRVFELMACNTLVISNWSKGVHQMFGDLVVFPDCESERFKNLMKAEIDEIRRKALHEVLENHTYKARWKTILSKIGISYTDDVVTLTFVSVVTNTSEARSSIAWYKQNRAQFDGSKLLLVAHSSMDPLEVARLYQNFNRFGVTVTSNHYAMNYATSERYSPVETSHFISMTDELMNKPHRVKEAVLHLQYIEDYPLVLEERFRERYRIKKVDGTSTLLDSSLNFTKWLSFFSDSNMLEAYLV